MSRKMTKEEYFRKEKEFIGTTTVDFDGPIITGGKGIQLRDLDDREILDFTGQISLLNTGYGSKEVVSAICQQAKKGVHSCISADYPYFNEITVNRRKLEVSRVALAEKLIEITEKVMPFKKRVFFEVSGAAAINLAAKIAQITYLRRKEEQAKDVASKNFERARLEVRLKSLFEKDIFIPSREDLCKFSFLAFKNAFHGRHGIAQLLTNSKPRQLWAVSSSCAVGRLPFPFPGMDLEWLWPATQLLMCELNGFAPVAAFVFEPIQGEGGINVPDGQILKVLLEHLHDYGIYIIADEVQTGLGRTGKMFACEHFGIEPDMMVLSKSLGAGIPIAAVIVNAEKFPDLEPGMHSGSHHATPLACAAAIANLDLILRKNLVDQSANHGAYLLRRLEAIKDNWFPIITDVRGSGLMIGIEFNLTERRNKVIKKCFEKGLLLGRAGEKVIRMTPPLIVTIDEIDRALDIFQSALSNSKN
jgi:4-aminobutyrate aminotransferase-like enzyme